MPGPPSPTPPSPSSQIPTLQPRHSLRWDTAQRAVRDGDLKTLQFLFEKAQLFEDKAALRDACISGAWGTGREDLLTRPFSTTDSIRLHTMLLHATERGHVELVRFILKQFPARGLHVAEWQIVVNAIGKGSVELLSLFVEVDGGLVNMYHDDFGSCFTVLFGIVEEKEKHLPVVQFFIEKGADVGRIKGVLADAIALSTTDVVEVLLQGGAR